MTQRLFCFGLGYSAHGLAAHLQQRAVGWQVAGTDRGGGRPNRFQLGGDSYIFDGTAPMADAGIRLCEVTHMLISVPPPQAAGDPVLRFHREDIAQLTHLEWLGYLSTTGVYGDRGGGWVDDDTAPAPTLERGRRRLVAEQGWLRLFQDYGLPVHIFRLGSIYGPGRGHLVNLLAGRGRKLVRRDGENPYFSRIHVDDLIQVLVASITAPCPGRIYNVVDNRPTPTAEVLDYICDLLGRPPLPETDIMTADLSPMMAGFYAENKRVGNRRIRQELGVMLKYPTYQQGYKALIRGLDS